MTQPAPLLGINIDPAIERQEESFQRAAIADRAGLDLATCQDHPYIPHFFDTWTLLAMLAARTERLHLGSNVSPLPLRPPAMLAKAAASLDVLAGGRIELGIGAGGYEAAIAAFGGRRPPLSELVEDFAEAIELIRGLWRAERSFSFSGEHYQLTGTRFGPAPAHPMRIWVGATKPRMLRLTGRLADGVFVSNGYVPQERLAWANGLIDQGAAQAGRPPEAIRRGYNLMGAIDLPGHPNSQADLRPGTPLLPVDGWVAHLVDLYQAHRMDTFIFWPLGERQLEQIEVFAAQVAPQVRLTLGG
ncbi:MAG TPA: LLM class flavin-dependent oxidoreductase [Thermomicrobiaceae bacterium]|nr:LLM class flavin-dependent oxidoreductase [Thermomicrobiaceae bacterium]